MSKIYLSPYTSSLLADEHVSGCAKSFAPLHAALRKREWPYDYGDDPSFFCRRNLQGALTWGVCRADVRSQVQPGDVVVFFSFTKITEQVEYRLSAIASVERKIRQSDIFLNPLYKKYRHYLNLLVRPTDGDGTAWEHYEPGSPEKDWHKNWLSRIVPHKLFSKGELKREAMKNSVSLTRTSTGSSSDLDTTTYYFLTTQAKRSFWRILRQSHTQSRPTQKSGAMTN